MDQGEQCRLAIMARLVTGELSERFDVAIAVDGAWSRRLLQTHLLRHRKSSLHGDNAESGLRQQMRLLLEVVCDIGD